MKTTLLQQIQDEADLCRNDGADDVASLLDDAAKAVAVLRELRDQVRRCVDLDDCGHANGVSLALVDAVKLADEALNDLTP